MLMQLSGTVLWIIYVLIATIILWLFLWLSTRIIVTKTFANDKKIMLLLAALLIIVVIPLISGLIGGLLGIIGNALAELRNLIYPGGANMLGALVPVIEFLLILIVLKLLVATEWKDAVWIALLGLFFLYLLLTVLPELSLFPFS